MAVATPESNRLQLTYKKFKNDRKILLLADGLFTVCVVIYTVFI